MCQGISADVAYKQRKENLNSWLTGCQTCVYCAPTQELRGPTQFGDFARSMYFIQFSQEMYARLPHETNLGLSYVRNPALWPKGRPLNIDNVSVQNGGSNQTGTNVAPGTTLNGSVNVNGVTNSGGSADVQFSPVAADLPSTGSNTVTGTLILSGIEQAAGSANVMITSDVTLTATGTR